MNLYEIKASYLDFMEAVENGEIPEEAFNDTLTAIQGEFEEKADNIACLIKSLNAESEAVKNEADKLADRAKTLKAKSDRLKNYLCENLVYGQKISTPRNVISLRPSKAVNVLDLELLKTVHPDLITRKVTESPNKTAIGNLIKEGQTIQGCELIENYSVQIK